MAKRTAAMALISLLIMIANATPIQSRLRVRPPQAGRNPGDMERDIARWEAEHNLAIQQEDRQVVRLLTQRYFQTVKLALRAGESQWRVVEPRIVKVLELRDESNRRVLAGRHDRKTNILKWRKYGEPDEALADVCFCGATDGKRTVDELIRLVEDDKTTDEQIRKKMEDLQQVRESAEIQLAEARRELREGLSGPRQEAVLLIMRVLD